MTRALLAALFAATTLAGPAVPASRAQDEADLTAPPDLTSPPADAVKSASGLLSKVITPGTGTDRPAATDYVTVHYTGWSSNGEAFDSSRSRGTPPMFQLSKSLVGWRECVGQMTVGETRRCWIPQSLAYRGQPNRPTGTVVFDVQLLDVHGSPGEPPPDVKEMPADATKTASGLGYRVLRRGIGARRPLPGAQVTVHYTGWTTDGKSFDSSVSRGTPATLGLNEVIPGWSEGLQLMVEGERTRFWIPQELAYKGESGSPRGMLVFDVELIRIER